MYDQIKLVTEPYCMYPSCSWSDQKWQEVYSTQKISVNMKLCKTKEKWDSADQNQVTK